MKLISSTVHVNFIGQPQSIIKGKQEVDLERTPNADQGRVVSR